MLDRDDQEEQELLSQENQSQEGQSTDTTTSTETDSSELEDEIDLVEANRTLLQEFGKAQRQNEAMAQQLAEVNARLARQETRQAETNVEPDPLDDPDIPEFEKKRLEIIRKLVQTELKKTTGPLNETARNVQRDSDLAKVRDALAQHPQTAGMYEAVKGEFDAILNKMDVLEPNLILALLHGTYGKASFEGRLPNANAKGKEGKDTVRNPSVTTTKKTTEGKKPESSRLSETDRTLMKRLGIRTEEEYLELRDGDGSVDELVTNQRRRDSAK